MTSLDRARRFLQTKTRALAAAAAPLAALVVLATPAKATLTFNTPSCTASSSGTCSGSQTPILDDGVNGISIFGNAVDTGTIASPFISASGSASGDSFSGSLPVTWDFTVTPTGQFSGDYSWTLVFSFNDNSIFKAEGGDGTTTQTFTGSDFVDLNDAISDYSIHLSVTGYAPSGGTLELTIPGGSTLDLNPAPEPASIFLVVPGVGLLWLRKRRNRP